MVMVMVMVLSLFRFLCVTISRGYSPIAAVHSTQVFEIGLLGDAALDELGIDYHVTGGLASSFYGEPRLTQDVDFVVRLATRGTGSPGCSRTSRTRS